MDKYWDVLYMPRILHTRHALLCFVLACFRSTTQDWRPSVFGEHDDVIKWKHFPCYWPFVRGIHRGIHRSIPGEFPNKGQRRGALMFSLIGARIKDWVNNGEAGDLRRHCAHYDVIVMFTLPHHHGHILCLGHTLCILCVWYICMCLVRCYRCLRVVINQGIWFNPIMHNLVLWLIPALPIPDTGTIMLTHWGLVTAYGDCVLRQHWLR